MRRWYSLNYIEIYRVVIKNYRVTHCREFEDDSEYYWDVIGSSRRNIPLLEARDENGNVVTEASGMIGAGTAPFYLVFGEDWFA